MGGAVCTFKAVFLQNKLKILSSGALINYLLTFLLVLLCQFVTFLHLLASNLMYFQTAIALFSLPSKSAHGGSAFTYILFTTYITSCRNVLLNQSGAAIKTAAVPVSSKRWDCGVHPQQEKHSKCSRKAFYVSNQKCVLKKRPIPKKLQRLYQIVLSV